MWPGVIVAIMVILLAVLALVVVKALAESPWGLFTIAATMPIALVMGFGMKAAGHKNAEIAMVANRNHSTIWARVGEEGDETAERIIRFVSR